MTIADYLFHLATDSEALAQFHANPEKSMEDASLSTSDKHLIKAGDSRRIQEALRSEHPDIKAQVIVTFLKITVVPAK